MQGPSAEPRDPGTCLGAAVGEVGREDFTSGSFLNRAPTQQHGWSAVSGARRSSRSAGAGRLPGRLHESTNSSPPRGGGSREQSLGPHAHPSAFQRLLRPAVPHIHTSPPGRLLLQAHPQHLISRPWSPASPKAASPVNFWDRIRSADSAGLGGLRPSPAGTGRYRRTDKPLETSSRSAIAAFTAHCDSKCAVPFLAGPGALPDQTGRLSPHWPSS